MASSSTGQIPAPPDLNIPSTSYNQVEDSDQELPSVPWGNGSAPSLPSVDGDGMSDVDSGLGGMSVVTSTASLRSSVYAAVEENGRTYHGYKQGKYPLPNDEQEQERLDLQHALFVITLDGKLHLAPIEDLPLHNALDIATGTGIWAMEFAEKYPTAQVLGTDLSTIQPLYVPPNCRFEIDDAEDQWNFSHKFNYIHGRALLSCFKEPSSVIRQAFDSLEPGGYLELQDGTFPFEYIGTPPVGSSLYRWNELIIAGAAKSGRPWTNTKYYKQWMEEIGFEDVVEKKFFWPTSRWATGDYFKLLGSYWQADMLKGLEGASLKILGQLGWDAEKIREFLVGVRADVNDTSIHAYMTVHIVYGRKPRL